MSEIWKFIPGFEGFYQASSLGRIKSVRRTVRGRWGNPCEIAERILVPSYTKVGYGHVLLYRNGVRTTRTIHVLVAAAFLGPRSNESINHIDGDKRNNRPSNLEYCSIAHNNRHALRTGLRINARGERHGRAKLHEGQIIEIRHRAASGAIQRRLANDYSVSAQTVCKIVNRQKWKHV